MPGRPHAFGFTALVLAAQFSTAPCGAVPPGYERDTRAYNLAHGRLVFNEYCLRCHESGRRGAPVVGETDDWKERIEQPLDTLIQHAIVGHGRMPPRGDQELGDKDVAAAVAYVVNRARVIAAGEGSSLPPAAVASADQGRDSSDDAVIKMLLLLLGKDRWK